jgi:hypothetical protein
MAWVRFFPHPQQTPAMSVNLVNDGQKTVGPLALAPMEIVHTDGLHSFQLHLKWHVSLFSEGDCGISVLFQEGKCVKSHSAPIFGIKPNSLHKCNATRRGNRSPGEAERAPVSSVTNIN